MHVIQLISTSYCHQSYHHTSSLHHPLLKIQVTTPGISSDCLSFSRGKTLLRWLQVDHSPSTSKSSFSTAQSSAAASPAILLQRLCLDGTKACCWTFCTISRSCCLNLASGSAGGSTFAPLTDLNLWQHASWKDSSSNAALTASLSVLGQLCLTFNLISSSCRASIKWSTPSSSSGR